MCIRDRGEGGGEEEEHGSGKEQREKSEKVMAWLLMGEDAPQVENVHSEWKVHDLQLSLYSGTCTCTCSCVYSLYL